MIRTFGLLLMVLMLAIMSAGAVLADENESSSGSENAVVQTDGTEKAMVATGVVSATLGVTGNQTSPQVATPELELATLARGPVVEIRTVRGNVTRDAPAQAEFIMINPTRNGDTKISGEIIFSVPPGLRIFGVFSRGDGSTGFVLYPFSDNPVASGRMLQLPVSVTASKTGVFDIEATLDYWPEGNIEAARTIRVVFPVKVDAPTDPGNVPTVEPPNVVDAMPGPPATETVAPTATPPIDGPGSGLSMLELILIAAGGFVAILVAGRILLQFIG